MATLFVMQGFPGSGKTFFAEQLAAQRGAVHLNSDRMRSAIFVHPVYTNEEHQSVYGAMAMTAKACLVRGVDVVLDANNNRQIWRRAQQQEALQAGADYLLVRVRAPLELALERVTTRGDGSDPGYPRLTAEVLFKMRAGAEGPFAGEPYVEIDGTLDPGPQIEGMLGHVRMGPPPGGTGLYEDERDSLGLG